MNTNIDKSSNRRRKQRGSSMIEFAIGSTVLIPLLFGTADFGRLFYASIEIQNAAFAGASYGSRVVSNMTDTTGISNAAKNDAPEMSGMTVSSSKVCQDDTGATVSCTTTGAYEYVKVTASYTFSTLFNYPFIPPSVPMAKTVMMRAQ